MLDSLREILLEKEQRLESVPNAFAAKVDIAQKDILRELLKELDSLTRTDGKIDLTTENIARIQTISERLNNYIFTDTDYAEALTTFAREFNVQGELSRKYFESIIEGFEDNIVYRQTLALAQRNSIDLLTRSGVSQNFVNPIKEILQASVTTGGSFTDAVQALTDYVIGNKQVDGHLLRYVKQVAYDGFAFSDANYMRTISEDLNFEWYQYFGGTISDSRCFCVTHSNGIYHKNEIEYWGETPSLWDKKIGCEKGGGRVPETNKSTIWTYRGGYNCRHQIVPVATTQVPKKWKDRAIKLGFISAS